MTNRNSSLPSLASATLPLDGTEVYYAVQNGADVQVSGINNGRPRVAANKTFSINSTSGNDTIAAALGGSFKTIQAAANFANNYDWQNIYSPTFNLSGSFAEQVKLPALFNCAGGGFIVGNTITPTSVNIADLGTGYTFTTEPGAIWTAYGFNLTGTYGGFLLSPYSTLAIPSGGKVSMSGNFSQPAIACNPSGMVSAGGAIINITSTSMAGLVYSGALVDFDSASITFANSIALSAPIVHMDGRAGFFAFNAGSFTGASNVTVSSGYCVILTNGSFFETGATTVVDGVAMTRANFPGHAAGFQVQGASIFQPDAALVNSSGEVFAWGNRPDGTGPIDTGISRFGPATMAFGNGAPNDFSGTVGAAFIYGASATGGIGYASALGAGGSVTQATNKSTAVTLNRPVGQITMNNALLGASGSVTFTLTNSNIAATDTLILNHASGGTFGTYVLSAQCGAGAATISVFNIGLSGGLSEAIVISFALIKGSVN